MQAHIDTEHPLVGQHLDQGLAQLSVQLRSRGDGGASRLLHFLSAAVVDGSLGAIVAAFLYCIAE